jgi:hypothetical protein
MVRGTERGPAGLGASVRPWLGQRQLRRFPQPPRAKQPFYIRYAAILQALITGCSYGERLLCCSRVVR